MWWFATFTGRSTRLRHGRKSVLMNRKMWNTVRGALEFWPTDLTANLANTVGGIVWQSFLE